MNRIPHAMSRYAAVTEGLIEKCQQDYYAGRDLGRSIPSLSAAEVAVVVAETLEADAIIHRPHDALLQHAREGSLSDWALAVVAEILFSWADDGANEQDIFASSRREEYLDLAWTALEHTLNSPTASPTLWYEQIYFEVAQRYRLKQDACAIELMQRGLVHDLYFFEAENALNFLRDLAETHLAMDQLDAGLNILARLLRFRPGDIWTYNVMAISFDQLGLTEVGEQATRRGLELLDYLDDPPALAQQLTNSLAEMRTADRHGREADVSPHILDALRQALTLDFEASQSQSMGELCVELIPDLNRLPRKTPKSPPTLPPPPTKLVQSKPGRNELCWCGSGKKYKHCHMKVELI